MFSSVLVRDVVSFNFLFWFDQNQILLFCLSLTKLLTNKKKLRGGFVVATKINACVAVCLPNI